MTLEEDNGGKFWKVPQLCDELNVKGRKRKHSVAFLRVLLKQKFFVKMRSEGVRLIKDIAFRPVTSYAKHVHSRIYRFAAIAANFVPHEVCKKHLFRTVSDFVTRVSDLSGKYENLEIISGGCSNYFTEVSTKDGVNTLREVINSWIKKTGRPYAVFPREQEGLARLKKHERVGSTFFKTGGDFGRTGYFEERKNFCFVADLDNSKNLYTRVDLRRIPDVAAHDAAHCYIRACGEVYRQVKGSPMGSAFGNTISNAAAVGVDCVVDKCVSTVFEEECGEREPQHVIGHYVDDTVCHGFLVASCRCA